MSIVLYTYNNKISISPKCLIRKVRMSCSETICGSATKTSQFPWDGYSRQHCNVLGENIQPDYNVGTWTGEGAYGEGEGDGLKSR
jgi:hypothetical protein